MGVKVEFPVYSFYIKDEVLLSASNYIKTLSNVLKGGPKATGSEPLEQPKKKLLISKVQISPIEFNLFIIDLSLIIELVQKKKYKYMLHLLQNLKMVYLKINRFHNTVS